MSEEYVKYFKIHKPARTTFGGAELGDGILVEIECKLTLNKALLVFFIVYGMRVKI